jgi:hypothetical protein
MASTIGGLGTLESVNTPLASAIAQVAKDLAGVTGPRIVVVLSDGAENCGGNPVQAIRKLRREGLDVTVNVVGLGLDRQTRRVIRKLADLGGGSYFDARDPDELQRAIAVAVSAPYEVRDEAGALVATGTVGGDPVDVPPGRYRIVVLTDPEAIFEAVVVASGQAVELQLGA